MKRSGFLKRAPFKKKKLPPLPRLKKKLWGIFSQHARRKDADENGMVKCISCPTVKHWTEMDAGHWKPKSLGLSITFLEINVHAQCKTCNLSLQGNQYDYGEALKKRYGPDVLNEIVRIQHTSLKLTRPMYLDLIDNYEEKLAGLGAANV